MSAPPSGSVALLAGPQLLGFFLGWGLQGVLSVQTYIYHLWFPRDTIATKCLVYGVFIYEWIQTILVTQTAFEINVYQYGDRNALTAFHNTWFSVTIMCAVVSAVVQGYFSWRIWVLSRSRILVVFVLLFAFCQMSVGVAGGVMLRVIDPTAAEASAVTPVISAWLASAAFVDIIIAAAMTFFLVQAKSGIRNSDALVDRLVRLVVETGTLTATVAIVDLICFTALPKTLLHECPALVLAKLYSNTLLVSLNNRAFLRHSGHTPSVVTSSDARTSLPAHTFASHSAVPPSRSTFSRASADCKSLPIDIKQEVYVTRDAREIVFRDGEDSEAANRKAYGRDLELAPMGRPQYPEAFGAVRG